MDPALKAILAPEQKTERLPGRLTAGLPAQPQEQVTASQWLVPQLLVLQLVPQLLVQQSVLHSLLVSFSPYSLLFFLR